MILNGLVMNTVYASDSDIKYPPCTWVNVTGQLCVDGVTPIQIGCTTSDNINFNPPPVSS